MAHDFIARPKAGLPKRGSGIRGTKGGPVVSRSDPPKGKKQPKSRKSSRY